MFKELSLHQVCDLSSSISKQHIVNSVHEKLMEKFTVDWLTKLNSPMGPSRRGQSKLCTVLVLIKLTKFAVALRLRCVSCKLIF